MTLYAFEKEYLKNGAQEIRLVLDDSFKTFPVRLKIYNIEEFIYVDIYDDAGAPLLQGHLVRAFGDVLDLVHSRSLDLPDLGIAAVPITLKGFDGEFNLETAGKDMDLMVVEYE